MVKCKNPECDNEVIKGPKAYRKLFCSKKCLIMFHNNKKRLPKKTIKCKICGREFQQVHSNHKYCKNLDCIERRRRLLYPLRPEVKIICSFCNKTFFSRNPIRKLCSGECRVKSQKKRAKEYKLSRRKFKPCLWCQEEFLVRSQLHRFCGKKECIQIYRTIQLRINSIFPFDHEKQEKQLQRLDKLGKYYQFPKKHDDLNALYQLKGKIEVKK